MVFQCKVEVYFYAYTFTGAAKFVLCTNYQLFKAFLTAHPPLHCLATNVFINLEFCKR